MSDSGGHAPHLAIASFSQHDFNPRCWNAFAKSNWGIARCKCGLLCEEHYCGWPRVITLNGHTFAQATQRFAVGNAFDLYPVGSRVFELRFGQPVLQCTVIGQ